MKKTHIILAAVILYLIIIVMGGSAYYAYTVQHNRLQAQIALENQQKAAAEAKKTEQTANNIFAPFVLKVGKRFVFIVFSNSGVIFCFMCFTLMINMLY